MILDSVMFYNETQCNNTLEVSKKNDKKRMENVQPLRTNEDIQEIVLY